MFWFLKKTSVQQTLFGDNIIIEYWGVNYLGDALLIPNFQPTTNDVNPRLDLENYENKKKK